MDNTICLNLVEGSDTNLSGEFTNIVDANESLCNEERSQRFDDAYLSLNTNPMAFTLNKYEKIRSWIYWKTIGSYRREFRSYQDCKFKWDPNCYSIRSGVKREIRKFKLNPLDYIKEEREYFKMRGQEHNDFIARVYNQRKTMVTKNTKFNR
jgi:hypothetical protein